MVTERGWFRCKNYSVKLQKYYFCTTTINYEIFIFAVEFHVVEIYLLGPTQLRCKIKYNKQYGLVLLIFQFNCVSPIASKLDFFDIWLNYSSVCATETANAFPHSVHTRSFCGTEHVLVASQCGHLHFHSEGYQIVSSIIPTPTWCERYYLNTELLQNQILNLMYLDWLCYSRTLFVI